MENSGLRTRILKEMEKVIATSSAGRKITKKVEAFHEAIIKKHYNASDIAIDYHRHRIKMNIIVNEEGYNPNAVNLNLEVIPTNLFFKNLNDFLSSCLESDNKSVAFYARLLQDLTNKKTTQFVV
ncbi:MAG: hypothetical protein AAF717_05165 [Bacteroidota bacterium]